MRLFEILKAYFNSFQGWHLMALLGIVFFFSKWHLEKKKLDREHADYDLAAYEKAARKIELKRKLEIKRGKK
jgi:hypothetical protein